MPSRSFSSESAYRYSFNSKEKDKEVVQYDYGFRIYDPRLGRFTSVDPLFNAFPELTPYQFASNSSIANVDLDGREAEYYTTTITYTTVYRTNSYGQVSTNTTSSISTKHEIRNGWIWGLIPNNGPLGTGTLYTVRTQVVEVYQSTMGVPRLATFTDTKKPITIGSAYKLSKEDEEQMNQGINRPQFSGKFQIVIFGMGNGMYPNDNTGSKPNPNAKTYQVDMNEWNEIFEPLLIASDIKYPGHIKPPEFGEVFNEGFEQVVDRYKNVLKEMHPGEIIPANGEGRDPNITTVCSMCSSGPHPQDGIDAYKVNKYGAVTDTLRKNIQTSKIDTLKTKAN